MLNVLQLKLTYPFVIDVFYKMPIGTPGSLLQDPSQLSKRRGAAVLEPLADVAFIAMMIRVLDDLHEELAAIPCLQRGFLQLGLHSPLVTWVDDVAIPVVCEHCESLESTLCQVADCMVDVFKKAGLILNFKSKKTEVVVALRGQDASTFRRDLFVERHGCLQRPS